jgi:hypothetical protein
MMMCAAALGRAAAGPVAAGGFRVGPALAMRGFPTLLLSEGLCDVTLAEAGLCRMAGVGLVGASVTARSKHRYERVFQFTLFTQHWCNMQLKLRFIVLVAYLALEVERRFPLLTLPVPPCSAGLQSVLPSSSSFQPVHIFKRKHSSMSTHCAKLLKTKMLEK